ncbi:hypothetical protein BKA69DRAFT_1124496 [Paraphysoderma sedebokerense]|nr:hypothetical protein BKA69DRAFT_1124496 [Paraphysoderma sedebokerense]
MSQKILKRQISELLRSTSSSTASNASSADPSRNTRSKKPIKKRKYNLTLTTHQSKDRLSSGVKRSNDDKLKYFDSELNTWIGVGEDGVVGAFKEARKNREEEVFEKNLQYFRANNVEIQNEKERERVRLYERKETLAKQKILEQLVAGKNTKVRNKYRKVVKVTKWGNKKHTYKHDSVDDSDDE